MRRRALPDSSVVEKQFVIEIAKILTTEAYQPYAVGYSDILGLSFRLTRGWPVDNQLVADLNANPSVTNITVFSQPGQRNTTRFLRQTMNQVTQVPEPTLIPDVVGNTVVFSGTGSASEIISVTYGNVAGASIRLTNSDTPVTVAQKFATALSNTSALNGVLTLPSPPGVAVGMDVTMLREVHRQCAIWRVTIWASKPEYRDEFASLIDPNLQGLDRFFFADGSCSGPIVNAGTYVDDVVEKQKLWKRDLLYEVEYPTDTVSIVPVMTLGDLNVNDITLLTNTTVNPDWIAIHGGSSTSSVGL
jgi:hypothetical protein